MSREWAVLWRWVPAGLWMALIFALSAQAGLRVSDDPSVDGPFRHVVHIVVYAVLAVLLVHAIQAPGKGQLLWLAALLATAYGVTDEIHQAFVPLRNGNLFDVLLDGVGALIGIGIVHWGPRVVDRRRRRRD